MADNIEIKSSLLNDKDFDAVKKSIISVSQQDHEHEFRVKLIEYINDTSDSDDDKFFYDMLPYVRFAVYNGIACTDETHRIFLNAPGQHIGKNYRQWDFTYDHECLHQLWDTFGVKDKIISEGLEYDHATLNVASDCVINDYLYFIRKKEMPDGLITPEYLKQKYGVEYDRKNDTQYSLYLKLIEHKDEIARDLYVQNAIGKIKPKSVNKQQGPPPPPPPQIKHSKDYIKGWTDAIDDVVNKKVDPTDKNYKPKSTGNNEYDNGYNDCMNDIKEGMENGISVGSQSGQSGGGGDLPQIPWDQGEQDKLPNTPPGAGGSGSKSDSNQNNQNNSDNQKSPEESANSAQGAADAAQDAADAAQGAADAAQEDANNGKGSQEAADSAQEAADAAQDAADKAQAAADKAKEAAENGDGEGAGDAAKEAGKAAKEAADAARKAAKAAGQSGTENGKDAAKNANAAADKADGAGNNASGEQNGQNNSNSSKSKGGQSQTPGTGHEDFIESDEDLEKLKKEAEEIIEDYKNKLAGDLGEFVAKGRSSAKLENSGLAAKVNHGVKGWNIELDKRLNKYVKQKVWQKKRQYQSTYSRIKRGSGYIKDGEPIKPGKKIKKESMVINAAFYIDRSGSMDNCIDTVFDACYVICEALKKKYRKEKVIEDIVFKILAFDDDIIELKYGKRCNSRGGTMSMEKLLKNIEKYSNNYLLNIVITDGYFNIDNTEVKNFIKNVNGIVVYIVNREFEEMKQLAKELPTKLFFIQADSDFKIDMK